MQGGLATASEALRGELKGTGVHVVTVYPGPIATAMGEEGFAALEDTPSVRKVPVGTATQLAKLVRTAVEKKQARIIYPAAYGLARNFPGFARWVTDLMSPKVKPNPPAA